MHVSINVKSPNNISKWQMGFNSAFKGLTCLPSLSPIIFSVIFSSFLFLSIIIWHVINIFLRRTCEIRNSPPLSSCNLLADLGN
jgi:hypothetical protein